MKRILGLILMLGIALSNNAMAGAETAHAAHSRAHTKKSKAHSKKSASEKPKKRSLVKRIFGRFKKPAHKKKITEAAGRRSLAARKKHLENLKTPLDPELKKKCTGKACGQSFKVFEECISAEPLRLKKCYKEGVESIQNAYLVADSDIAHDYLKDPMVSQFTSADIPKLRADVLMDDGFSPAEKNIVVSDFFVEFVKGRNLEELATDVLAYEGLHSDTNLEARVLQLGESVAEVVGFGSADSLQRKKTKRKALKVAQKTDFMPLETQMVKLIDGVTGLVNKYAKDKNPFFSAVANMFHGVVMSYVCTEKTCGHSLLVGLKCVLLFEEKPRVKSKHKKCAAAALDELPEKLTHVPMSDRKKKMLKKAADEEAELREEFDDEDEEEEEDPLVNRTHFMKIFEDKLTPEQQAVAVDGFLWAAGKPVPARNKNYKILKDAKGNVMHRTWDGSTTPSVTQLREWERVMGPLIGTVESDE